MNPQQLQFLAQHIKEIVADIKPKYKYGVPAVIFNDYLDAYILRAQPTNEVNNGLQQAAGANILLGIQQIMGNMINPQAIIHLSQQIHAAHQQGLINNAILVALDRDLGTIYQAIPNQQFFQALGNQVDANVQAHIQQQLNNALQDMPTVQQVNDLQRQLQQAMTNNDRARAQQVADALQQILQLQPAVVQTMAQIKAELMGEIHAVRQQGMTDDIKDEILQELRMAGIQNQQTLNRVQRDLESSLQDFTRDQIAVVVDHVIEKLKEVRDEGEKLTAKTVKSVVKDAIAESLAEKASPSPLRSSEIEEIPRFIPRRPPQKISSAFDDIMDEPFGLSSSSLEPFTSPTTKTTKEPSTESQRTQSTIKSLERNMTKSYNTASTLYPHIKLMVSSYNSLPPNIRGENIKVPTDLSAKTDIRTLRRIETEIKKKVSEVLTTNMYKLNMYDLGGGGGAKKGPGGKGLHRMHGSGLSKPTVILQTDFSQGIMPTQKYVPFGRYFIDHHRINDDIMSLRRGNGVNIFGLPVRRVTKDLGEVVRTILKNGHPSYNQIDKLTKEEKDYLYKVAKSSNLLDRLNIPAPTKEEDDQDINQFEILKGELLCGNDGNETIKKFKVLVMRMMNKGLLPKGQAKEILLDLATMGY